LEKGKARAMVQLLAQAWRGLSAKPFVESLPIAGVDGTLAHRLQAGPATGQAWLKTGTLAVCIERLMVCLRCSKSLGSRMLAPCVATCRKRQNGPRTPS
ncbi:MAG: D-alanyl-D-alanine carboxypeptidase, partial [Burkholderiales bacterium]|nr:D-alanyl-D-alanine carboxypeptidase [Burkholderiales bacterium]